MQSLQVEYLFPWRDMSSLLAALRRRPAMWLGEASASHLQAFMNAWICAERFHHAQSPLLDHERLARFEDWVADHYANGSNGLASAIALRRTGDEAAAFRLWFEWYDAFELAEGNTR